MPNKYRVTRDGVKISGTQYNEGDIVELTDEVAGEVGDAVELDEEATASHTHHKGDENFEGSDNPGNIAHPVNPDGESANEPVHQGPSEEVEEDK